MSMARLGVRAALALTAVVTATVAVVSCATKLFSPGHPPPASAPTAPAQTHAASPSPAPTGPVYQRIGGRRVCMQNCRYLGIAVPNQNALAPFVSATGVKPKLVEVYQRFGAPFALSFANAIAAEKQMLLVQINPYQTDLAAVAAGHYDSYLTSYAAQLRQFHGPVALSFAHEMNGSWYPWGCRHTGAADFVAAYRRVVTVISHAGAKNVIWVWTTNVDAKGDCPLADRWPGNSYVTWVGVDGYIRKPGRTFTGIFGRTFGLIHQLTKKPILLAETGILIGQPGYISRLADLFHGAGSTPGVIGIVYFDSETKKYGDYRPQDNPAMLAAFRKATSRYLASG